MPTLPAARTVITLRSRRAALVLLPLLLLSASPRLVAQEPVPHRVEAIELRPTAAGGAELVIVSSAELGLVGVRADPQGGLFLQLPQHALGPAVLDLHPRSGLVSAVESTVDRTSRGPLTRITVSTRRPVAHTLSTEGRRLSLRLRGLDEEPEEAALHRLAEELRTSLAASERARQELSGRVEALVAENRELAQSFETLEERRSDLDGTLKATLGEVTEMLRGLSARTEELNQELRQAEGREEGLRQQVARLESELEASAGAAGASLETEAELARLEAERDALRQEIRAREAKVEELEASLEAQRAEFARLEEESLALATRMSDRLAAATAREDELRSQLEVLGTALADARELERPPNVELESALGDDLPVRGLTVTDSGESRGRPASGRTTHGVRLRRGPGIEFEVLRGLAPGTAAEVLGRDRTWLRVRLVNGQEGWVHGAYFELSAGGEGAPAVAAEPPRRAAGPGPGQEPGADREQVLIVVATETEEPLAASFAAGLRAKGYSSEVYWSDSGYYVVTLDRLPVDPARQERDRAVAAGDVPADSYLIPGSTLRKPPA